MANTRTLSTIARVFLSAQGVCDEVIRSAEDEPVLARIGFLAADVCLAISEEDRKLPGAVAAAMADVFHSLGKTASAGNDKDSAKLSAAMFSCERAALDLSDYADGLSNSSGLNAHLEKILRAMKK